MARKWIIFAAVAGILTLLSPLAHARTADAALEGALTDSLASAEDIKRYSFEMREPGDAVIVATGLQDHWDGYAYHWRCTVYAGDLETAAAQTDVRGYAENYGPSILAVPDLDAGTYYVQMESTSAVNPLMTTFTSDPYQLRVMRYYYTETPEYSDAGFQAFQNAGDLLWAFDGTAFLKLNDGPCVAGLIRSRNGAVVPILISADRAGAEYVNAHTGEKTTGRGPWSYIGSDESYYYSECGDAKPYSDKAVEPASIPSLFVETTSTASLAAKEILLRKEAAEDPPETAPEAPEVDPVEGPPETVPEAPKVDPVEGPPETLPEAPEVDPVEEPEEDGGPIAWAKEHWDILLGVFVVVGLVSLGKHGSSKKSASRSSGYSYSGSGYSGSSYSGGSSDSDIDWDLHDELDAIQHAMEITERYGEDWTGYDPEAPTDSSDIW